MLIFPAERLVFLCTAKCASTSVEDAYAPYAGSILGGSPTFKHISYRQYAETLMRFGQGKSGKQPPPETVCIVRHPIDHLRSWYRYRKRDSEIARRSTKDVTFEEFVERFLQKDRPRYVGFRTIYQQVQNEKGEVGVDRIFSQERLDLFVKFMNDRLDARASLPVSNSSPPGPTELPNELEARLLAKLEPDLKLYSEIMAAGGHWVNPNSQFRPKPQRGNGSTAQAALKRTKTRMKLVQD